MWFRGGSKPLGSGPVDIGWVIDAARAGFIWQAPRKLTRSAEEARHSKSVQYCPAVHDHDSRLLEVLCPVDVHLRVDLTNSNAPKLIHVSSDDATIRSKHLSEMVVLIDRKEWRHPQRPILQMITPYIFLADEPVWINQEPPFSHFRSLPWPGVLINGRFPIHIWPRPLVWAFEWCGVDQDLVLKRGEPWFYLRFETFDPSRSIRPVEAEFTPELKSYVSGLSGVTNFVNRTFSLFSIAKERRPKRLLVRKKPT